MRSDGRTTMTKARQWWVVVCYKHEPGAGFGKQSFTAASAVISLAKYQSAHPFYHQMPALFFI